MKREEISFLSGESRCGAWWYVPEQDGPWPCIIMAHGFGNVKEAKLDAYAEKFAANGYAVLVFDYRHFGASEGQPRQLLSVSRQLEDWLAAIAWARKHEYVDQDQVILWGTSFSAGHVLTVAAKWYQPSAVIAQVPFTDGIATAMQVRWTQTLIMLGASFRDVFRQLSRRSPYSVPIVAPPGQLGAMTSPDAEQGYMALLPDNFPFTNQVAARIFLTLPLYRPCRVVKSISCPVMYCIAEQDVVTPPGPSVSAGKATPHAVLKQYPVGHFEIYEDPWFERVTDDQLFFLKHDISAAFR